MTTLSENITNLATAMCPTFIRLTLVRLHRSGNSLSHVYVNPRMIASFAECNRTIWTDDGWRKRTVTAVYFVEGDPYTVAESPSEILDMIAKERKNYDNNSTR